MKNFKFLALAAILAAPFPAAATTTTYTYAIDYNFPILRRGNQLGSASKAINGRGSVKGEIVLGDDFLTTSSLISYALTTTNSSTASNVENLYSFSSTDPNETFAFLPPSSVWEPYMSLRFSDQSYAQPCSATSPTGLRGAYSIAGSTLTLEIDRNFKPGDAGFSMQAWELFGKTAYCSAIGFPLFEHEHTAPNTSTVFASLISTSTGPGTGTGTGGVTTPVPVPAALPLLLAGLGGLGLLRRRHKG